MNQLTPVTLPPGRLMLATRPRSTGSSLLVKTIGIVLVACHGDERRIVAAGCGDHGHLTPNEFGRERRQPIRSSLRPAIFDRDVLTLDVAGLVQASAEGGHRRSERLRRLSIEESDHRHRRLLRARRKRPRGAAPPSSVMNSRRPMPDMGLPLSAVCRKLSLP